MSFVDNWSIEEVLNWLDIIKMPQYKRVFKAMQIDGYLLSKITMEDLVKDFKISNISDSLILLQSITSLTSFSELSKPSMSLICNSEGKAICFKCPAENFYIGSDSKCHICLPNLSQFHCHITLEHSSCRFFIQNTSVHSDCFLKLPKISKLFVGMVFCIQEFQFTVLNMGFNNIHKSITCAIRKWDGEIVEFGNEGCSFGRAGTNKVVLKSSGVYNLHAKIRSDLTLESVNLCYIKLDPTLLYPFYIGSVLKTNNYLISFE